MITLNENSFSLPKRFECFNSIQITPPALVSFQVFLEWVSTAGSDINSRELWKQYDLALNRLLKICVLFHIEGKDLN